MRGTALILPVSNFNMDRPRGALSEMMRLLWPLCLVLISGPMVSSLDSQTPDAKAELELGIAAYKEGYLDLAIQHLEHVVSLEPTATLETSIWPWHTM